MLITKFVYNNSYYVLVKALLFYLIYNYYLKIYYKVKNNFIEEEILLIKKYMKQFYKLRKILAKYLENTVM